MPDHVHILPIAEATPPAGEALPAGLPTRAKILAELATLPDEALVAVPMVAALYDFSERHAWRAADKGDLPRPLSIGRLKKWRLGDLREHIRRGCPRVRSR
jgi:predicted DNA-binding transcriptional regulator AlpA